MASGYMPEWQGVFEATARKTARENYWRVRYIMTEDDAVQCCAEAFTRCLRYCQARGGRIDSDRWFMGIFKLAMHNEIHYYAKECGHVREADAHWAAEEESRSSNIDENTGPLSVALSQASSELQDVMRAVASAPVDLLSLLLEEASDTRWSRRLCRLCGIRLNESIVAELRDILTPEMLL
jgi:hypothetical protein